TLALPPGWCCIFAFHKPAKAAQCARCGTSDCCCPCSAPQQQSDPDRCPSRPTPIKHCPCTDRNTTLPASAVEKMDVDLALVTVLHVSDELQHTGGFAHDPDFSVWHPLIYLHVLLCRWLC